MVRLAAWILACASLIVRHTTYGTVAWGGALECLVTFTLRLWLLSEDLAPTSLNPLTLGTTTCGVEPTIDLYRSRKSPTRPPATIRPMTIPASHRRRRRSSSGATGGSTVVGRACLVATSVCSGGRTGVARGLGP